MAKDTAQAAGLSEAQVNLAKQLQEEMPRIDAALKNFLSLRMAEGLTAGDAAGAAAPLRGCARVLLRALNAADLPEATEWGRRHPQGEEERGMDYMARIGEYRVVQVLWAQCRTAGQKPAALLGRSALRFAYPEITAQLLGDAPATATAAGVTEEELRDFVDAFGRSLAEEDATEQSDADIIWAKDMKAALGVRQMARKKEAEERLQRASTAEDFAEQLRTALGSQGPQQESSVQVEELTN